MKNAKSILTRLGRYALTVLVFMPLLGAVARNWDAVRRSFASLDGGLLLLSLFLLMLVLPLMATISSASLRSLAVPLPFRQVFGIYFITQAPKYLPGGFWAFPGRMLAYQVSDIPLAISVLSVFREVAALFLGAVLVSMFAIPQAALDPAVTTAILLGVFACLAAIGLTQFRFTWRILARLPFVKQEWLVLADEKHSSRLFSLKWVPLALACSLIFWLAMGVPFYVLVLAIHPAAALSVFEAATTFALSWSAGFAVVFVPAGLGVRESVLTLLLARWLPLPDAISLALLSRLWWMAIEALYIAISLWILSRMKWLANLRLKKDLLMSSKLNAKAQETLDLGREDTEN